MSNQDVYRALAALQESGETAALCTVIRTQGSVPRREGAKMLVYPDGRIVGTVGGGEMEARIIARARAPIGLAIGAETPREIAASILGEIIAHRQGRDGRKMQWFPPSLKEE